jgi:leader peptidase (prepilin peptidase) / N-methyltransferase
MDPSSGRDAGASLRGQILLIVLIGALAAGLSFAASPDLRGAFGAGLALLMLAIAVSDLRYFRVPDPLSGSAFVLGLMFAGLFGDGPMTQAVLTCLLRAVVAALPLLALMLLYEWWRGRPGLGLGDVKLAAVAGVWLDWFTIVAVIEVAALAALAAYGVWRLWLRRPIAATTPLPFGLFLAPAIWLGWLAEAWHVVMP